MRKIKFYKEVVAEIENIKKNATEKEIKRLDFDTFNHVKRYRCIYGQMTGHCSSIRAKELTPKRYAFIKRHLNGFSYEEQDYTIGIWYTALEKYLFMCNKEQHKEIISYLKGDINTFKLNFTELNSNIFSKMFRRLWKMKIKKKNLIKN